MIGFLKGLFSSPIAKIVAIALVVILIVIADVRFIMKLALIGAGGGI